MRYGFSGIKILHIFLIGLLVGLLGCGSDDFLDEPGNMYTANLSFSDVTGSDLLTIDVARNLDCDADGTPDDPEDYGPLFADLTLRIDESVNGLTLVDYEIQYIPLSTPLSGGGTIVPIALTDNVNHGNGTDYFPSGVSSTLTFTFMTTQTKAEYLTWWTGGAPQDTELDQGRYTFRLTCFFEDDFGVEREMEFERTVFLGNFDNC